VAPPKGRRPPTQSKTRGWALHCFSQNRRFGRGGLLLQASPLPDLLSIPKTLFLECFAFGPKGGKGRSEAREGLQDLKKSLLKVLMKLKKKPIKSFDNSELISFCYKLIRLLNKIIREKGDTGAKSTHFFSYYL
jgi:hypothetical protein